MRNQNQIKRTNLSIDFDKFKIENYLFNIASKLRVCFKI